MFTSDDYRAVTKNNNTLYEAYAAVYAQENLDEATLSAKAAHHANSYEPEGEIIEAFDVIAQHLYVEGYASTIESAEAMAMHISEDWAEQILEAHPNDLEAPDYKDAKRIMNQGGKQPPQKPKPGMDKLTGLPVKGV